MNLLDAAKRVSSAALMRVNFVEGATRVAKEAGYTSLQAALADLPAAPTLATKKRTLATPPRAKGRHRRPETVTKEQLKAALEAGLTGKHIALKFGRTQSWLNKRKQDWKLRSPKKS
jgi:hypothetical protein